MPFVRLLVFAAGLGLIASSPQAASVVLHWTAPGDDGRVGRASQYDLRYATSPITDANWANSTRVSGLAKPLPYGNREQVTVQDLLPSTNYYFALKSADELSNWSPMSNVLQRATCGGCVGITGNVNGSTDNRVDLADLAILVQFLTSNQGTQLCVEEANVDASPDGLITLSDLSLLIAFLTSIVGLPACP
jgi:hypothetical protein